MSSSLAARWASRALSVLAGAALALGPVAVAFADDCSGPSDCAGTTWFNSALSIVLPALLAGLGLGGLSPFLNLLYPNLLGDKPPRAPLGPPPSLLTAQGMQSRIRYIDGLAQRHHDPTLAALADKYRDRLVGPDGRVRVDEWRRLQEEFRATTENRAASGDKPNSWLWDAGAAFGGSVVEFGGMVGGVIYNAGAGIVHVAGAGIDALLHPIDSITSVGNALGNLGTSYINWIDSLPGMRDAASSFNQAMRDGRYLDALGTWVDATGTLLSAEAQAAWRGIKTVGADLLALDEIQAIFSPDTDLETRLWAIPSATVKAASLLLGFERLATAPVPGLGATSTLIPSVRAEAIFAVRLTDLAPHVESLGSAVLAGPSVSNFQQVQQIIARNPELAGALDDVLRAGGANNLLAGASRAGAMSRETELLLTARRIQLQEQAMANATRRIIEEEARSIIGQGQRVPGTFQSFNATEGSRTALGGANVKVDLDQTLKGLKNVTPERAREILAEECRRIGPAGSPGFTPQQLDTNVYVPRGGLVDATGDKPFSEWTLQRILEQNTSRSSTYQVYVDRAGGIHVTGPFNSPGSNALGISEQVGGVSRSIPAEALSDLTKLTNSVQKYYQSGDYAAMIKSANRASRYYGQYDTETRELLRTLAGEKRPAELEALLASRGLTWQELASRLKPGA